MAIDVSKLLFRVDDNTRTVSLCLGLVGVEVCESPEDFADFVDLAIGQLRTIQAEIEENYVA